MTKGAKIGIISGCVVVAGIVVYALFHSTSANAATTNTGGASNPPAGTGGSTGGGATATTMPSGATIVRDANGNPIGTATPTACGKSTIVCVNGKKTTILGSPSAINNSFISKIMGIRL